MTVTITLSPLERSILAKVAESFKPKPPKPRKWASPLDMACDLDHTVVRTPALELINQKLVALADGTDHANNRLLVAVSPQEGKSTLCSKWFPLWKLVDDPSCRVAVVSYSDEMARRWGSDIKQLVETFDGTDDTTDLEIRLRGDSRAAGRWQIEGQSGGVYCVGISGSLTGKPVDCVSGTTRILTEYGYAPAYQIAHSSTPPRALSYNHGTGETEWRHIVASRIIGDRPLVEVVTTSGRRITCTPDHRIFTATRGYVPAVDLRPGEPLVTADRRADHLRTLRDGVHAPEISAQALPTRDAVALLEGVPVRRGVNDVDLRGLRLGLRKTALRRREGQTQRVRTPVLHQGVLFGPRIAGGYGTSRSASLGDCGRVGCVADHRSDDPHRDRQAPLLLARGRRADRRNEPQSGMRHLRHRTQEQIGGMPTVLPGRSRDDVHDDGVQLLRLRLRADARRGREAAARRAGQLLLRSRLRRAGTQESRSSLPEVQEADGLQGPQTPLLLEGLSPGGQQSRQGPGVPTVRSGVLPEGRHAAAVLRSGLCRRRTFAANGRCGQLALPGRHQLRRALPPDASADLRARRQPVQGMLDAGQASADRTQDRGAVQVASGGAPLERGPVGQSSGEPDPALRAVPRDPPQVGYDAIHMVRHLHGVRDTVYDFQVDGNSNFFADEVLVHNCLIIDDPIKDLSAAQSEAYRKRCRDFWQGVAVPRLGPGAKCLLVQTRWHEDDMAGWLLASEGEGDKAKGGRWQVVSIPAQADADDDPLGRSIGEFMQSARGDRDWEATRKSVGSYVWASLYQQRPSPAEGGLFKRLWWRYWSPAPTIGADERVDLGGRIWRLADCWKFGTVDLANSTKTSADWTVAALWAQTLDGDLVLLDFMRARVGEEQHFDLVRPLADRWHADTFFVERSQYGTTLARDAARTGVHLTPIDPESDKFSRALPYSARASAGRVWLPAGSPDKAKIWVDEHAAFPNGSHDDTVDTGSFATRVAVTKWQPPPAKTQPDPIGRETELDYMSMPL